MYGIEYKKLTLFLSMIAILCQRIISPAAAKARNSTAYAPASFRSDAISSMVLPIVKISSVRRAYLIQKH